MRYNERKAAWLTWFMYFSVAVVTFIGVVLFRLDHIVTMIFFFLFLAIIAARCCHTLFYKRKFESIDLLEKLRDREPLDFFDDFFVNLIISVSWIFLILTFSVALVGTAVMFLKNGIYDNVWACAICIYWPGAIIANLMFYVYSIGQNGNDEGAPLVFVYGTSFPFIIALLFAWLRMTPFVTDNIFVRILVMILFYAVMFVVSYLIPRSGFIDDVLYDVGNSMVDELPSFSLRDIIEDITGLEYGDYSGGSYKGSSYGQSGTKSEPTGQYNTSGGSYSEPSIQTPVVKLNNCAVFDEVEAAIKKWALDAAGYRSRKGPVRIVYDRYYMSSQYGFDYNAFMYASEDEAKVEISGLISVEFGEESSLEIDSLLESIAKGVSEDILYSLEELIKKTVENSKYASEISFKLDVSKIKYRFECRGRSVNLEFKDFV